MLTLISLPAVCTTTKSNKIHLTTNMDNENIERSLRCHHHRLSIDEASHARMQMFFHVSALDSSIRRQVARSKNSMDG